ncbi:MAG: hypothetical protein EBR02_02315 [Alphaproteobacteria bacterium]|nr:hypothetical protein [Alphaproteobacteria bacterium]
MEQKPTKKNSKPFAVKPSTYAACVELCEGNTAAGGFLCQIAIRSKGKALKDENNVDGYLVLTSQQWRYVTGFTRHQHNDALSYLKKKGLIQYRRRRLTYKDSAALVWIRLPDGTKSAMAEIMARPAISAFSEVMPVVISVNTDNSPSPISGAADVLIQMNIKENEDSSKNVIIGEITTVESTSKLEKESKKNKKVKCSSLTKKDWFNATIKEIYKDSNYSPEPFKEHTATILLEAKEYLETNPGNFFEFCFTEFPPYMYALNLAIVNWGQFIWFSEAVYNSFKMPLMPQLWSLKHQLKVIPEFVKFRRYIDDLRDAFLTKGLAFNAEVSLAYDIDVYFQYLGLPIEKRQAFIVSCLEKSGLCSVSKCDEKIEKLEALAKLHSGAKASG